MKLIEILLRFLARRSWCTLYALADLLYFVAYRLIGYRKRIVRRNLANSFPEKSEKERRKIEKRFYRQFCDVFVETIKKLSMTEEEMKTHFRVEWDETAQEIVAQRKNFIFIAAHYGNWEWFSPTMKLHLPEEYVWTQVYRKQKNEHFDALMQEIRSRFGVQNMERKQTLRTMMTLQKSGQPAAYGFLSDQSPSVNNIHHYIDFLHQKTPIITGTEQIAQKLDLPVFVGKVSHPKRGYYTFHVYCIAAEPKKETEFAISEKYMSAVEKMIYEEPEWWLWSHKRWKHANN